MSAGSARPPFWRALIQESRIGCCASPDVSSTPRAHPCSTGAASRSCCAARWRLRIHFGSTRAGAPPGASLAPGPSPGIGILGWWRSPPWSFCASTSTSCSASKTPGRSAICWDLSPIWSTSSTSSTSFCAKSRAYAPCPPPGESSSSNVAMSETASPVRCSWRRANATSPSSSCFGAPPGSPTASPRPAPCPTAASASSSPRARSWAPRASKMSSRRSSLTSSRPPPRAGCSSCLGWPSRTCTCACGRPRRRRCLSPKTASGAGPTSSTPRSPT
jgi:hypothetical protein